MNKKGTKKPRQERVNCIPWYLCRGYVYGENRAKAQQWVNYIPYDLCEISAYSGSGDESVQVKIRRAQLLLEKLNQELIIVTKNIRIHTVCTKPCL